ncbi:MAG: hypothetical protein JXQ90_10490 [Cyclobacteriaceae bacterium]
MQYRTIVRYSGIYDLLVTAVYALPWTAVANLEMIGELHERWGMSGNFEMPGNTGLFFINLMGAIVTIWSVLRIKHPLPLLGLYDGIARFSFSAIFSYYLLAQGLTSLIWFFLIPELIWGVVQVYGYVRLERRGL